MGSKKPSYAREDQLCKALQIVIVTICALQVFCKVELWMIFPTLFVIHFNIVFKKCQSKLPIFQNCTTVLEMLAYILNENGTNFPLCALSTSTVHTFVCLGCLLPSYLTAFIHFTSWEAKEEEEANRGRDAHEWAEGGRLRGWGGRQRDGV